MTLYWRMNSPVYYDHRFCWADPGPAYSSLLHCTNMVQTDVGLCAKHYEEIVGREAPLIKISSGNVRPTQRFGI